MNEAIARQIEFNDFELPIEIGNDCDYYINLQDKLLEYSTHVRKIFNTEDDISKNVDENIGLIHKALANYQNAKIDEAKKCILKILRKYETDKFLISPLNDSYSFRGIAPFMDLQYKNNEQQYHEMNKYPLSFYKARIGQGGFSRTEMLHIPFNQRNLVSTQRFSIPGIPCLYLGTTSYVCWLEMNKPNDNEFNVSSYKLPDKIRVLNLTMQQMLINGTASGYCMNCGEEEQEKLYARLIKLQVELWPLICATSYSVKNPSKFFRSDYIISQLVMLCLDDLNVDGVAYLSKKISDYISYPQGVNLALPIKGNGTIKFERDIDKYGVICKCVELTDPINFSDYSKLSLRHTLKHKLSYINAIYEVHNYNSNIDFSGRNIPYQHCEFSQFDNYLFGLDHKNAEIYMKEVTAIIIKEKLILIAQRRKNEYLAGKWEFPGGKIEFGETSQQCLSRKIKEELNLEIKVEQLFNERVYTYPKGRIKLLSYFAEAMSEDIKLSVYDQVKWVSIDEMDEFDFVPTDIPLVERLKKEFNRPF